MKSRRLISLLRQTEITLNRSFWVNLGLEIFCLENKTSHRFSFVSQLYNAASNDLVDRQRWIGRRHAFKLVKLFSWVLSQRKDIFCEAGMGGLWHHRQSAQIRSLNSRLSSWLSSDLHKWLDDAGGSTLNILIPRYIPHPTTSLGFIITAVECHNCHQGFTGTCLQIYQCQN